MKHIFLVTCCFFFSTTAVSQIDAFIGEWLLWLETDNRIGMPAVGSLVIEDTSDNLSIFIDGGPVNFLGVNGSQIRFDFDWSDLPDLVHLSVMEGTLKDDVIEGIATENGENRGAWRATRIVNTETTNMLSAPVDFTGIWSRPSILSKHGYDLTEVGETSNNTYDPAIDDPILRCVSDGLIRMSHGPFSIEVVKGQGRLIVLHEDLHEVRRIYLDGRDFPEEIDDANLAMGYSIGHWEGSTLVVESRGLKRTVWDAGGMPISSGARVTERWYLDSTGQLHVEFSLYDPVNYHRPAEMHTLRQKQPDDAEIMEYSCDPHAFYRSLQLEGRLEEYWGRSINRR
ncbi:MAG: hypothetical protein CMM56_06110 [Rhodospirillaceae bacterium]|nr:hypothetical protein [Rhodospirillaceae bacterium]